MTLLRALPLFLLPLSIALTTYLYLYPVFHNGCVFPSPPAHAQRVLQNCDFGDDEALRGYFARKDVAPFRLLALGDPQLEGDTSLPPRVERRFPGLEELWARVVQRDVEGVGRGLRLGAEDHWAETRRILGYARKQADLLGNDFYLAHIYRTLKWWTVPTHVTVLGDLLGSQWIGDDEFERRAGRFWTRVFRGGERVPGHILKDYKEDGPKLPTVQVLGQDERWKSWIINLAGNHDIGYAGDIEPNRIERFERAFGGVNGDVRFTLPLDRCSRNASAESTPTLRIVVLNSMNIDSPALYSELQQETFAFINSIIETSEPVGTHAMSTILLTHIPLHKEPGTCVDSPLFSYFDNDVGGGIKEQNMISKDMSAHAILQAVFGMSTDTENMPAGGMGRDGIILTGHDHEGCDVYHHVDRTSASWTASRWESGAGQEATANKAVPGIRELTARSMMGEFGGNAVLLSAWWDDEKGRWDMHAEKCSLGVQHVWWAVHVIDLLTAVVCILALVMGSSKRSVPSIKKRREDVPHASKVEKKQQGMRRKPRKESLKQETKTSPPKSKLSAFSRRMQETLEEDRDDSTPAKKRKKTPKKPDVKLKYV